MNLLGTQFNLQNKAYEIYLAGCDRAPHCEGCHNPESWDFNNGEKIDDDKYNSIISEIKKFYNLIENIWILGGEPLDQNVNELLRLVEKIREDVPNIKMWLFTGYTMIDLIDKIGTKNKSLFDFIKCGAYIKELTQDNHIEYGVKLATSNQHIYKIEH